MNTHNDEELFSFDEMDFAFSSPFPTNDNIDEQYDLGAELEKLYYPPTDYTLSAPISIPSPSVATDDTPSLSNASYLGLLASYGSDFSSVIPDGSLPRYQEDVMMDSFPLTFPDSPSFPLSTSPTGFSSCGSDWTGSLSRSSSIFSIDEPIVADQPIVRRKSKGRKTYDCTYCGKIFNRSYCLNSHLVTHTFVFTF